MSDLSDRVKLKLLHLEKTDDIARLPELEITTINVLREHGINIVDDLLRIAREASGELIRMPSITVREIEKLQRYCIFLQGTTD
ncbi:hypothetical protein IKD49_02490 [Candidatus Saccharibacteria bacterium]|nr:hypothetical protein [Candidatus Saccharibacteria bacterium]